MFRRLDVAVAANTLTSRWAARLGPDPTVLSGAGVWPLLALLAAGADGDARVELEDATGIPAEKGLAAAGELLDLMGRSEAVRAALGLWSRADVALRPEWAGGVPPGTRGTLTGDPAADQRALDAWAAERTAGRIARMPVTVDEATPLVLASALLVRTAWFDRFREAPVGWCGGEVPGLRRATGGTDAVKVYDSPAGALTCVEVAGEHDVSVHLVLGEPERGPGELLPAAVEAVTGRGADPWTGARGGPGLAAREERTYGGPELRLALPGFEVAGGHDLTRLADVFGIATALDPSRGHFPGITPYPLAIAQGRQDAVARFTAEGFEAAAVTAFSARVGSAAPRPERNLVLEAAYDRPFGFVAVHRPSRLVLVAGWVPEPLAG